MAPERTIRRFSRTERALHWAHATAFFVLLGSGLVLYLPRLSELVARRNLIKDVHLYTGLAWATLIALLLVLGLGHGLRETIRELERFDADDLRWLLRRGGRAGRFNAGQKLNAIATAAFAVLFAISGFLLWYGERDTRFRLANTILLHDGLMYASLVLLAGHLYLSLIHPSTRHALRGITHGTVDAEWAGRHHPRWAALAEDPTRDSLVCEEFRNG
ncbi:MAG: hypothetical protein HOQ28_17055 [Thermoleophilia bacterium]|nr:hypothetical protein [Thermoleophilia bacterium]